MPDTPTALSAVADLRQPFRLRPRRAPPPLRLQVPTQEGLPTTECARAAAQVKKYLDEHELQSKLSEAVNSAVNELPANPLEFIGNKLITMASQTTTAGTADSLNILLQEDLTIRGGAQLWLMNCGSRLQAAGHNVTFLLPTASLIIEDCEKIEGERSPWNP